MLRFLGSPSPSPLLPGLFVVLQEILYQPFLVLTKLLQKIMHFQSKTNFFFQLIADRFWFCYSVYIFFRVLFHSSAIMKLQIALYLHISIASYLTSHQIMWHNKRINGHGLKITSCFFLAPEETKFKVDTTSIILGYLYHFGNVNKELFKYC